MIQELNLGTLPTIRGQRGKDNPNGDWEGLASEMQRKPGECDNLEAKWKK